MTAKEIRRKQLDHERYIRQREDRLRKQKAYYKEHKAELKKKRQNKVALLWQERYNTLLRV